MGKKPSSASHRAKKNSQQEQAAKAAKRKAAQEKREQEEEAALKKSLAALDALKAANRAVDEDRARAEAEKKAAAEANKYSKKNKELFKKYYAELVDVTLNNVEDFTEKADEIDDRISLEFFPDAKREEAGLATAKYYEVLTTQDGQSSPRPLLYEIWQKVLKLDRTLNNISASQVIDVKEKTSILNEINGKVYKLKILFNNEAMKYSGEYDVLYCFVDAIERGNIEDLLDLTQSGQISEDDRIHDLVSRYFKLFMWALAHFNHTEPGMRIFHLLSPDAAFNNRVLSNKPFFEGGRDEIVKLSMQALRSFTDYYARLDIDIFNEYSIDEGLLSASDPRIVNFLLANGAKFNKTQKSDQDIINSKSLSLLADLLQNVYGGDIAQVAQDNITPKAHGGDLNQDLIDQIQLLSLKDRLTEDRRTIEFAEYCRTIKFDEDFAKILESGDFPKKFAKFIQENLDTQDSEELSLRTFLHGKVNVCRNIANIHAQHLVKECNLLQELFKSNDPEHRALLFQEVCKYGSGRVFEKFLKDISGEDANKVIEDIIVNQNAGLSSSATIYIMKNIDRFVDVLSVSEGDLQKLFASNVVSDPTIYFKAFRKVLRRNADQLKADLEINKGFASEFTLTFLSLASIYPNKSFAEIVGNDEAGDLKYKDLYDGTNESIGRILAQITSLLGEELLRLRKAAAKVTGKEEAAQKRAALKAKRAEEAAAAEMVARLKNENDELSAKTRALKSEMAALEVALEGSRSETKKLDDTAAALEAEAAALEAEAEALETEALRKAQMEQKKVADKFRNRSLGQNILKGWRQVAVENIATRRAQKHYKGNLRKKAFDGWKHGVQASKTADEFERLMDELKGCSLEDLIKRIKAGDPLDIASRELMRREERDAAQKKTLLKGLTQSRRELRDATRESEDEKKSLESKIKSLEDELAATKKKLEERERSIKQSKKDHAASQNDKLLTEVAGLEEKLKAAQEDVANKQIQIATLKDEMAPTKRDAGDAKRLLSEEREKLAIAEKKIEELKGESKVTAKTSIENNLKREQLTSDHEVKIAELETEIAGLRAENSRVWNLSSEGFDAQAALAEALATQMMDDARENIAQARSMEDQAREMMENAQRKEADFARVAADHEVILRRMGSQNVALNEANAQLVAQLNAAQSELGERRAVDAIAAEVGSAEGDDVTSLPRMVADLRADARAAEAREGAMRGALKDLRLENVTLREMLDRMPFNAANVVTATAGLPYAAPADHSVAAGDGSIGNRTTAPSAEPLSPTTQNKGKE